MKKVIIPVFCALALVACTGGQKQNNGGQTAEVGDSAEIMSDNFDTESASQTNIAEEIFKKLFPDDNCENGGGIVGFSYGIHEAPDDCEGCHNGSDVYCYPKNNGGYLVVSRVYDAGPGCMPNYIFSTSSYKDGAFDKEDVCALPSPKLEMLLNPNKISGHESNIAEFKAMYDKNPGEYLFFQCLPPNILKVELYPWDCDEAVCNMDQCMLSSRYDEDQLLEYTWDGAQFVVNPETVPSTNLESIGSSCDIQEIWRQFKELEIPETDYDYEADSDDSFECGSNTIKYELGSDFIRKREIKCFESGDAYNVYDIYNTATQNGSSYIIGQYIFKDGKLTSVALQPELSAELEKVQESTHVFFDSDDHIVFNDFETEKRVEFVYDGGKFQKTE